MSSSIGFRITFALAMITGTLELGAAAQAESPLTFKTFDAPGAGNTPGSGQGTLGLDINDFGVVAGLSRDQNSVRHGYLRYPGGKIIIFDHPNAGTNGAALQGTRVGGLNALGAVAGSVRDAAGLDTPYIRDPEGIFHDLKLSDFAGGNGDAINLSGAMVGNFVKLSDPNSPAFLHYHGFIRNPNGSVTIFDPPGSTMTEIPPAQAINDFGVVTGDYWVCSADLSSCTVHAFTRSAKGQYTSFDVPGAGSDGYAGGGTFPAGINNLGDVTGAYGDANSIFHGFIRSHDGRITTFDLPTKCTKASSPPDACAFEGTFPAQINVLGQVVGSYSGENGNTHGFLREADGSLKKVNAPGAGNFTGVQAINDFGKITGYVIDANSVTHGLIVTP